MKDLKHLIYFENLLQEANNDLVKQATSEGKRRWPIPAITFRKCCSILTTAFP